MYTVELNLITPTVAVRREPSAGRVVKPVNLMEEDMTEKEKLEELLSDVNHSIGRCIAHEVDGNSDECDGHEECQFDAHETLKTHETEITAAKERLK